jgi:SAM-dependent methyltransferase
MDLWLLSYHRKILNDPGRLESWREAIRAAVKPGDVVVDVGAGTGILSFLACAAGARQVYAIEGGETVEVARDLARRAGLDGRIQFFNDWSNRVRLPERADVVCGDLLSVTGLNGNILGTLVDARDRFLKPGGVLLPCRLEMYCAPVEVTEWHDQAVAEWSGDIGGFDHRPCRAWVLNAIHGYEIPPAALLAEPAALGSVDLATAATPDWQGRAEFRIARAGVCHALGAWHQTWLDGERGFSNAPLLAGHLHYPPGLFPIETPVAVEPGDVVEASIRLATHGSWMVFHWEVTVRTGDQVRARFEHSTLKNEVLSLDRLRRSSPTFAPRTSALAAAARDILELSDGSRPVAQIRAEIERRHGGSFAGPQHVADFVTSVVRLLCQ